MRRLFLLLAALILASVPIYAAAAHPAAGPVLALPMADIFPAAPSWTLPAPGGWGNFGHSVSGGGDLNADGYDDVVIGAPGFASGAPSGVAVAYGGPGGLGDLAWNAWTDEIGTYLGASVSLAPDVNGDGRDDIVVGAPGPQAGAALEGNAFAYYSSSSGLPSSPGWKFNPGQPDGDVGRSVAGVGDVNKDGYGDVVIGAPRFESGQMYEGKAFLFLGSATGLGVEPAWTYELDLWDQGLGQSVAAAGDVNGDGYADVLVGSCAFVGDRYGGQAFLFLGSDSSLSPQPDWTGDTAEPMDSYACTVAGAGDVNGDGYDDILVGAMGDMMTAPGKAYLYLGSANGPATEPAWIGSGTAIGKAYGDGLSAAGDVNQDGYGDVLVSEHDLSIVNLYLGTGSGLQATPVWTASRSPGMGYGWGLASAGDVNADGAPDILIGAPDGGANFVDAYYGSPPPTVTTTVTPTATASITPSKTPTPTPTASVSPTISPTPTPSDTPSPTAADTQTATPTYTKTLFPTPITATPKPTSTPGPGAPHDLGTLGGHNAAAAAINNRGWIVGSSDTAAGERHAFLWKSGRMTDLGTLGGDFSAATDLNESGTVVGQSRTASGAMHPFLWRKGVMTDLGTLGGYGGAAFGINDRGDVVGEIWMPTGGTHAFLWRKGVMTDLGTLGGESSSAAAINNLGVIVGLSQNAPGDTRAIQWSRGKMTDLGTLGGDSSSAMSINLWGQIVGTAEDLVDDTHAVRWTRLAISDLGTLGGSSAGAEDVNELAWIVGSSLTTDGETHAFVWRARHMIDLGTLDGGDTSMAFGINIWGRAVGWSNNGEAERAVQWAPR